MLKPGAIGLIEDMAISRLGPALSARDSLDSHEIKLSQAISLKRIADALEKLVDIATPEDDDAEFGAEVSDSEPAP